MEQILTPKQVARAIGVSEASLKRWCDKGLLRTMRTPGGHRRIAIDSVIEFIRTSGSPLVEPQILGLPPTTGQGKPVIDRARQGVLDALRGGEEGQIRRYIFDLYLAGVAAVDICDQVVAPVFIQVGEGWYEGELEVYQERRGCDSVMRVLNELRQVVPQPASASPMAIGGTLEDDPYTLPTLMIELTLRECGWNAQSLGSGHPVNTLQASMDQLQPRLFWLSVSAFRDSVSFIERFAQLSAHARDKKIPIVVGGRALTEPVRRRMEYSAYGDRLRHLVSFVESLTPQKAAAEDTFDTNGNGQSRKD